MSTTGPDDILQFHVDTDDATPVNIDVWVKVKYHNGADTPETHDLWNGQLDKSDYDSLSDEAVISQGALDADAGSRMGNWYSTKPPGFKKAFRSGILVTIWPVP